MHIRTIIRGILLLYVSIQLVATASPLRNLKELYNNKQYFELRDALKDRHIDEHADLLFYRGAVGNKFNQLQLSITYFKEYLKREKEDKDSELLVECYEMLADDYLKTYQYQKAAEAYNVLLTKFAHTIDAERKSDFENSVKLCGALSKVPRQTVVFYGSSIIKKDQRGYIPLEINNQKVSLTFDTGANLSVITNSFAEKLALTVINVPIDVVAVAGNKVKARLGVARAIRIGNAIIRNVVFLVFDDKDLYISEADFQINGLVGFPVIEALREVTFVRDGEIYIPNAPATGGEQNMCLDGLSPLIAGWFKDKRLVFALDTGASRSTLYPPFYQEYEDMIKAEYEEHNERVRGVGGYKEIKGYLAKNITMRFSGRVARFAQIPILTERTTDISRRFYGNLGQDLIKQFEKMTLNFKTMSIVFE
jgi:predicted aspartyl protease